MIEGLVTRQDYHVVAMKEQGQLLSFLVVFVSPHEDVALLEYLATSPQARSKGLGAALFAKAVELAGTRPLLVEFDSEREASPDRELRLRRKQFYLRQGCQQIKGLDYLMPQVGDSKPPLMDLAFHWKGPKTLPGPELVRRWLKTIYTEVYARPGDDPAIDAMIAGLRR